MRDPWEDFKAAPEDVQRLTLMELARPDRAAMVRGLLLGFLCGCAFGWMVAHV